MVLDMKLQPVYAICRGCLHCSYEVDHLYLLEFNYDCKIII